MSVHYSSTSSSESDNETTLRTHPPRLLGRRRPIPAILGGGQVADVLLWKKKTVSAGLLIGMTLIWFLFEVVEYNFVTLLCHMSITAMLVIFIWFRGAEFFNWNPPKIPEIVLRDSTFREVASAFRVRFNQILSKLLDIACGKDPRLFILAIASLYILSVIGTYFTFLNLLYLGFICVQTLPFLYDKYEDQVDYIADRQMRRVKKTFKRFNSRVLNKIPRQPAKEN